MSYSISISGWKDGLSPDEAEAFEQKQAETAKRLVAELDDVTGATFYSASTGSVNLLAAE